MTTAPDLLEQLIAAKSLATNNGLNYHYLNTEDLAQPVQEIFTKWPPGLSVIVSIGFIFTDNIRIIYIVYSFINIFIFLSSGTYLIQLLTDKISRKIIFIALFGFYAINGTFIYHGFSTDLICLNLFILSNIFLLKFHERRKASMLLLACLCLSMTVYFRYAYFPVLLALPGFYLIRWGFQNSGNRKLFFRSCFYMLITSLPFLLHVLYINSKTSYITGVSGDGTRFYWSNLKYLNPFPLNSFIEINTLLSSLGTKKLHRIFIYPYYIDLLFYLVSIILIGLTVHYVISVFRKTNKENPKNLFFSFGVIVAFGLMALIYLGSLITPSRYDDFIWTWARIMRYFYVPIFIIHLSYLLILLDSGNKWIRRIVLTIFIGSILSGLTVRLYTYIMTEYKLYNYKANEKFLNSNNHNQNSFMVSEALPSVHHDHGVVLIDSGVNDRLFMAPAYFLYRNYTSMVLDKGNKLDIKTSKPMDVYILTDSSQVNTSMLIDKYEAQLYKELENGFELYVFQLLPRGN